jgi:lipopolysaccharide/colanic/teichoic acid biosynthesis glycosyltransferase
MIVLHTPPVPAPPAPVRSLWLRVRTLVDRLVASLLLLAVAPVILSLAVVVRRHDGGPAFVAVPRMGAGGRTFRMWKLRSMRAEQADGRARGVSLSGAVDERITPVGRRLRAYYLDELPQLLNVVRGEMSLLGPRPEAPEFVDLDDPAWQLVLTTPPGLAGPTQMVVNDWERELIDREPGGTAYVRAVVPVKLAIDHWYVQTATPVRDALIFVTLVRRFLPGTESTTLRSLVFRQVPDALVVREWQRARRAPAPAMSEAA